MNKTKLREDLQKLLEKGIQSLAVAFLHSYTCVLATSIFTISLEMSELQIFIMFYLLVV